MRRALLGTTALVAAGMLHGNPAAGERFVEAVGAAGAVPPLGIVGADAIREAFEGDLRQLQDLLQSKIKNALELAGEEEWWPYVHGLFPEFVVVEHKDGRLMRYGYSVDGTEVALTTPVEVVKTFVPAAGEAAREAVDGDPFLEASSTSKGRWRIRVIRGGPSLNGNYYPEGVLREAAGMFEGVRVFAKSDAEHLAGSGKDVRNLVGALKNAAFVEASGGGRGEIHADLVLIEPDGSIGTKIREAWDRGLTGLFGFSIDARAKAQPKTVGGKRFREAVQFLSVASVDLIVEPGAGGGIIQLLEAAKGAVMDRTQIISILEAGGHLRGRDVESLTDEQLVALMREAAAPRQPDPAPAPAPSTTPVVTLDDLRMVEARGTMRDRISRSKLPAVAQARLVARFNALERFTEAEVEDAIREEIDYVATFSPSGVVTGLGQRVQIVESQFEKVEDMLDAFFDREHRHHRQAQSFKECYVVMTGDHRVTGHLRHASEARMREALGTSSFDAVLGDGITRRLLRDYRTPNSYDVWRQLADAVPVADFRTQERTRFGGYGDLPAVAQAGNYDPLTSPTDDVATYAVTKRGGTEKVTLEMIKNDDVGAIRRIPINLSRAAKRTLSKFVLDFLRTNPTISDGVALFHASRGNLGTAALDKASYAAGRLAMLKRTEMDSNDRLGLPARNLWLPSDLEETGVDLFRRNTENDETFIQSTKPNVIPVWYWTDVNNWYLTADKMDVPTVEIGFLDGNEEPELFVQDAPNVGSMFSNDQLTWKIRHIYGGNVVDDRGFYGAVVADP